MTLADGVILGWAALTVALDQRKKEAAVGTAVLLALYGLARIA